MTMLELQEAHSRPRAFLAMLQFSLLPSLGIIGQGNLSLPKQDVACLPLEACH